METETKGNFNSSMYFLFPGFQVLDLFSRILSKPIILEMISQIKLEDSEDYLFLFWFICCYLTKYDANMSPE